MRADDRMMFQEGAWDHEIEWVAERMRQADIDEVKAASGRDPLHALRFCVANSTWCVTAKVDWEPVAIFGVATVSEIGGVGSPWMLGTDVIERHQVRALRHNLEWIDRLRSGYHVLRNAVDDRNEMSKRWLKWLGFELGEPINLGYENRPFRIFEMRGALDV